jgi:large subunit ribosomal protein L7/L12
MSDLNKLAETLVNLTVKEVNELASILKDEYGIEPAAAAPVMMAGGAGSGSDAPAAVEKTSFDVILKSAGASKLNVVKPLKEGVAKDEAEGLKKALEEAGAEVEIK